MTPITDHVDQALDKLIQFYKRKPRFAAWCASHIRQIQLLEDATWAFLASFDVDTCDLVRLRYLAKIVGQEEIGDLETFRLYVKTRILVNRSQGKPPQVLKIARSILGTIQATEFGHSSAQITGLDPLSAATIQAATDLTRAAMGLGGRLDVLYLQNTATEDQLTWSAVGDESTNGSTQGFATADEAEGGYFAAVH